MCTKLHSRSTAWLGLRLCASAFVNSVEECYGDLSVGPYSNLCLLRIALCIHIYL